MIIENLIQVGYFSNKQLLLIMYGSNEREVVGLDIEGNFLYNIDSPIGYKMIYFQETSDNVLIVCDGDENHKDKYGRSRMNFELDILTGKLILKGLAYWKIRDFR